MKSAPYLRLAVALAIALAAQSSLSAADWVSFSSEDGQFKAVLPTAPEQKVELVSALPRIPLHWCGSTSGGCEYAVLWNDYPPEVMARTTAARTIGSMHRDYVEKGKRILSDKAITLDGRSVRTLEVDVGGGLIHQARFMMVGNRL